MSVDRYFCAGGPKVEMIEDREGNAKVLIDGFEIKGVKSIKTEADAEAPFMVAIEILPSEFNASKSK